MVAAAIAHLTPKRQLDPWELRDLQDVLEAAAEWAAGRLPLEEFARVGMIEYHDKPSSGYTRFLALQTAGPMSSAGQTLLRAVDALVARDRGIRMTATGCCVPLDAYIDTLGSHR